MGFKMIYWTPSLRKRWGHGAWGYSLPVVFCYTYNVMYYVEMKTKKSYHRKPFYINNSSKKYSGASLVLFLVQFTTDGHSNVLPY